MSYSEWAKAKNMYQAPPPIHYGRLKCPKCGRFVATRHTFIHVAIGRSRWCRHCKVLFNADGLICDVLEWYDQKYCQDKTNEE